MQGLKFVKSIRGTIFIIVMLISMLMILIGVSASNMLLQDAHMVKHLKRSTQAQYLAEAGINVALVVLAQDFSKKDTSGNFPKTYLGAGYYHVTVSEFGNRVLLSSEGEAEGVTRTVDVEVKDLGAYPEALKRALATGGDMKVHSTVGHVTIYGDIHANGDMTLQGKDASNMVKVLEQSPYDGDATCHGTYTEKGSVQVDGVGIGGQAELDMPNFDFAYFKNVALTGGGVHYSDDTTFQGAAGEDLSGGTAGITYVDGTATFKKSAFTITGGFVAKGKIELKNSGSITQNHSSGNRFPIFMSNDECDLKGPFNTQSGNIVYATNSATIYSAAPSVLMLGAVLSGGWIEIKPGTAVTLTYSKIESSEVIPSGGIEIVSWNR